MYVSADARAHMCMWKHAQIGSNFFQMTQDYGKQAQENESRLHS